MRVKSLNLTIPMAWDDHQCPFRDFRNGDTEGLGGSVHSRTFSLKRTIKHFFLLLVIGLWQSWCVWPAYGLQWLSRLAGCLIVTAALSLLAGPYATLTMLVWINVGQGKRLDVFKTLLAISAFEFMFLHHHVFILLLTVKFPDSVLLLKAEI